MTTLVLTESLANKIGLISPHEQHLSIKQNDLDTKTDEIPSYFPEREDVWDVITHLHELLIEQIK